MHARTFGRYELLERIGIGQMAEVFKAMHRGVGGFERLVAIKRLLPSIAADSEIVQMLIDEAKVAVQLSHPSIAQIFDLGRVGTDYFIAMEYVDGASLADVISRLSARGKRISLRAWCRLIMELADALDYAHFAQDPTGRPLGIIHRDVSPHNILVSFAGEAKIIDFGFAKAANRVATTREGMLADRIAYLSPEQANGRAVDRRSDIFSLGIVAWEMLTGRRAFQQDDERATMLASRAGIVEPPSRHVVVPQRIERAVMRALAPDPEERHATARELHDEVSACARIAKIEPAAQDLAAMMRSAFPERFPEEDTEDDDFPTDRQLAWPTNDDTHEEPAPRDDTVPSIPLPPDRNK